MSFRSAGKRALALVVLLFCGAEFVFAHPTPMSSSVVDVYRDRVNVEVRVMVEDFVTYYSLEAGADFLHPAEQLKQATERHREFLEKYLILRDAEGERIGGRVTSADLSDVPEEGVYAADLMSFGVTFKLEYPLERPLRYLNISQQFAGHAEVATAMMDVAIFQAGVWTQESLQIGSGQYHIAKFDWENPVTETPRTWQERTGLRNAKQQEMLGITSFTSVYSFVYVSSKDVRHELLVPLAMLKNRVSFPGDSPDFLEVAEQVTVREQMLEFVLRGTTLEINGESVTPEIEYINFYGLDARDFAEKPDERRVSVHNDRVGIALRYPNPQDWFQSVKMTWNEYNDDLPFLKSVVETPDAGSVQHFFVPEGPGFEWRTEVPILHARRVNVGPNEGFSENNFEDTVSTLLLELHRSSLETGLPGSEGQGRDFDTIESVNVFDAKFDSANFGDTQGFAFECGWSVEGEAKHWGHVHAIRDQYQGVLRVGYTDGRRQIILVDDLVKTPVVFETRLSGSPE